MGPEGTFATLVDGRDRWRFSFTGSREHRSPGEAELGAAIGRAVGCRFDFEITSVMPYHVVWCGEEVRTNLQRTEGTGAGCQLLEKAPGWESVIPRVQEPLSKIKNRAASGRVACPVCSL